MVTTTHLIHRAVLHERPTAVIRANVETARVASWVPLAYRAIEEYLSLHGIAVTGPPFARYTAHEDGKVAVEAGYPVSTVIAGDDYVKPSTLPHGPVGMAIHSGGHGGVEQTYRAIRDWLALHGYTQDGPAWEVYPSGPVPLSDPSAPTEVVIPYRPL